MNDVAAIKPKEASSARSVVSMTQIPIPCKVCGAPMKEVPGAGHLDPVALTCDYCHASETLPGEPAKRVVALRTRLSQIKWLHDATTKQIETLAQFMESSYWPVMAVFILLLIGFQIFSGYDSYRHTMERVASLDDAARNHVLSQLQPVNGIGIGALLGVLFGLVVSFVMYRKAFRPALFARAPLQPGYALRCRQCGGDLPKAMEAFIACSYCKAQNLVTDGIAKNQARLLEDELKEYRHRAAHEHKKMMSMGSRVMKIYYIALPLGILLGLFLGSGINALIRHYL